MINKDHLMQLIKYGFYGVITTIFNLVLFYVMIKFDIDYIVSNIFSYGLAVLLSYYFNDRLVFGNQADNVDAHYKLKKIAKYILIRVITIAVDSAIFFELVSILKFDVLYSRIVLTTIILLASYLINKIFVFTSPNKAKQRN